MSTLLIKELRERTGAGFLDCKKALEASNNDVEKAIEWLQKRGTAKAAKKAGAIAAEGVVSIVKNDKKVVIYEVNSQTDFVATNAEFLSVVNTIGNALMSKEFSTPEEANAIIFNGKTITDICIEATAKIGEKIVLRRANAIYFTKTQKVGAYVHVNKKVASIVITEGGQEETTRNVAMHVTSMNPLFLDETSIPNEKLNSMKEEISKSEVLLSRPERIRENIAKGMLRKQLSELTLVDQEFVMEKMPVSKYLSNNSSKAIKMIRFEVGEGIEKKVEDFAAEVAAQMAK